MSEVRYEPGSICRNAAAAEALIVTAATPTSGCDRATRLDRISLVTQRSERLIGF